VMFFMINKFMELVNTIIYYLSPNEIK
jgi:hypothetical protein